MLSFLASAARPLRFAAGITLLTISLPLTGCGRRSAPPITSINDEPAPPSEGPHHAAFVGVAEKVRPAVVVLATFDEHGGLVANEHAFFISANGDLLAEQTAMNDATSAIVKGADGHAYETLGTYVRSASPHFILLKTNARNVPYLPDPKATAEVSDGAPAAIILSAGDNARTPFLEGRIAGRKNDEAGEWLTFEPSPAKSSLGAPVVDVNGAIIGIVAQRNPKDAPAIFRYTGVPSVAMAEVSRTEDSKKSKLVSSPAEGLEENPPPGTAPTATPPPIAEQRAAEVDLRQLQAETSTPLSTPKGFFIRMNPNWHIHAKDRPQPSADAEVRPVGKLIYTPLPRYSSKRESPSTAGSGSYRLTFNAEGKVTEVRVARSAGSSSLDDAAIATLRNWRAEPGREWSVVVPVKFGR